MGKNAKVAKAPSSNNSSRRQSVSVLTTLERLGYHQ